MRLLLTTMAVAMLASTHAHGAEIDIQVDNFTVQRGISEVVLRVTNNTGKALSSVFIDCVFMTEDERAIDIGKAMVPSMEIGATKFEKAAVPTTEGVAKALCEIRSYR